MILKARNIHKSFTTGQKLIHILNGISLDVKRGDMIAIMGVSGSGKSTLLHILGLLNKPDEGDVEFLSEKVDFDNEKELADIRNRHIGFVFQFYSLMRELTVKENILLPAMISNKQVSDDFFAHIIELVGLDIEKVSRVPSTLSGGEQQRAALARALINEPDLIIADEPTANLDKVSSIDIVNTMVQINAHTEQSFIIATHSQEVAKRCKRILFLSGGKLSEKD